MMRLGEPITTMMNVVVDDDDVVAFVSIGFENKPRNERYLEGKGE